MDSDGDAPAPGVVLAGAGAVMGEVAATAAALAGEGVRALVLELTSADRCYAEWRAELRAAAADGRRAALDDLHLARLLTGPERRWPIVTVHDSASHALAWLGSVFGAPVVPVGVDAFGQSGSVEELYRVFDLLPEQIVNAALVAIATR
jgi:pyruvate dehydrogenase E1 component